MTAFLGVALAEAGRLAGVDDAGFCAVSGWCSSLANALVDKATAISTGIKVRNMIHLSIKYKKLLFCILEAKNHESITDIQTTEQAAQALRPIAGEFAFLLFSAGVIGTGMLAIPVLAGSAAYAVAGAFGWSKGLDLNLTMGKRFYGIIAASTLIGAGIGLGEVDPIKALYWAAVVNGVISVPIMVVMMLMAQRRDVMGPFVVTRRLKHLGWAATAAMAIAVAVMFGAILCR